MLESFTPPIPEDDSDRKLLADIEQYGWHCVGVHAEDGQPAFAFTVGLYYLHEHPELLVMGLPHATAHSLLTNAVEQIRDGARLGPGKLYESIATIPLAVVPILFEHYPDHLGYAMWFYRSLPEPPPAIQLVWPDAAGRFPWQAGYDTQYLQLQTMLNEPGNIDRTVCNGGT